MTYELKLDLLGIRATDPSPPNYENASTVTIVDLCAALPCANPGEKCVEGICKCGTRATCAGVESGAYCDVANSQCKCSETVDSCGESPGSYGETCQSGACKCGTAPTCVGQTSKPFCDATSSVCKCSPTVDACTGSTDTCYKGTCKCGTAAACSNSGETCQSGTCKCGTATTCVGSSTAPYCDQLNSICKCSASVAACSSREECSGATCVSKWYFSN